MIGFILIQMWCIYNTVDLLHHKTLVSAGNMYFAQILSHSLENY